MKGKQKRSITKESQDRAKRIERTYAEPTSLIEQIDAARKFGRNGNMIMKSLTEVYSKLWSASMVVWEYIRANNMVVHLPYSELKVIADIVGFISSGYEELNYTTVRCFAVDLITGTRFEYTVRQSVEESKVQRLSVQDGIGVCLLSVIPDTYLSFVVNESISTVRMKLKITPATIGTLLSAYDILMVGREALESHIGVKLEDMDVTQFVELMRLQKSILAGRVKQEDYFR